MSAAAAFCNKIISRNTHELLLCRHCTFSQEFISHADCPVLKLLSICVRHRSWRPRVFTGERKRKILCSRESDRVVVSDQRCHGTTRPAVITEPCNAECELRFVQWNITQPLPLT